MSQGQFRVRRSSTGYCVEFCRGGQPYATFVDGLTKQAAEQEMRALTLLWRRIAVRRAIVSTAEKGK